MNKNIKRFVAILIMTMTVAIIIFLSINQGVGIIKNFGNGYFSFGEITKKYQPNACNNGLIKDDRILFPNNYQTVDIKGNHIILTCKEKIKVYPLNNTKEPVLEVVGSYDGEVIQTDMYDYLFLDDTFLTLNGDYDQYFVDYKNFYQGSNLVNRSLEYIKVGQYSENNQLKYGLLDSTGKTIKEPIFDQIGFSTYHFIDVEINEKHGIIDLNNGNTIVPIEYDEIRVNNGDRLGFLAIKDGDSIWYDYHGLVIESSSTLPFDPSVNVNRAVSEKNGKYGIVDWDDQVIVDYLYDYIYEINRDNTVMVKLKNKFGVIDLNGNVVVEIKYDSIHNSSLGRIVKLDGKYGMLDEAGNGLIEIKYDEFNFLAENRIEVKLNGDHFVIDRDENVVIEDYDVLLETYEKITFVKDKDLLIVKQLLTKYGLIDYQNNKLIHLNYERVNVVGDFVIVRTNDQVGLFDLNNNQLLDVTYKYINIEDPLIIVDKNGKYGAYDLNMNLVFDLKYDRIKKSGNFYLVIENGKFGLFDLSYKPVTDVEYDYIGEGTNGFILQKNGILYYADSLGTIRKLK